MMCPGFDLTGPRTKVFESVVGRPHLCRGALFWSHNPRRLAAESARIQPWNPDS